MSDAAALLQPERGVARPPARWFAQEQHAQPVARVWLPEILRPKFRTPVGPLVLDYGFNVDRVLNAIDPSKAPALLREPRRFPPQHRLVFEGCQSSAAPCAALPCRPQVSTLGESLSPWTRRSCVAPRHERISLAGRRCRPCRCRPCENSRLLAWDVSRLFAASLRPGRCGRCSLFGHRHQRPVEAYADRLRALWQLLCLAQQRFNARRFFVHRLGKAASLSFRVSHVAVASGGQRSAARHAGACRAARSRAHVVRQGRCQRRRAR